MSFLYTYDCNDVNVAKLKWEIVMSEDIRKGVVVINLDEDFAEELHITLTEELKTQEKYALDLLVTQHSSDISVYQKNHQVLRYDSSTKNLKSEEWYETNHHNGTFSGLRERTTYSYQNGIMASQLRYEYYKDGKVRNRWQDGSEMYTDPYTGDAVLVVDSNFERNA